MDKHIVLFDGECVFCQTQVRWLRRLDWRHQFDWLPNAQRFSARRILPDLDPQALDAAIHCVTQRGEILQSSRALRFVFLRLPLLLPVAVLLWIPGMLPLAERVYQWVSRHRHRL